MLKFVFVDDVRSQAESKVEEMKTSILDSGFHTSNRIIFFEVLSTDGPHYKVRFYCFYWSAVYWYTLSQGWRRESSYSSFKGNKPQGFRSCCSNWGARRYYRVNNIIYVETDVFVNKYHSFAKQFHLILVLICRCTLDFGGYFICRLDAQPPETNRLPHL